MKKITLFRHGRARATDFETNDFNRALTDSGIKDVKKMALKLIENKLTPNLIINSGAKRAKQTAEIIATVTNTKQPLIDIFWLYTGFVTSQLLDLINSFSDDHDAVAIVGHNPYISEVAIKLCQDFRFNLPTSGNLTIGFDIEKWSEIKISQGKVIVFEYPN